ncbi:MAG: endosialidase [Lachnospiraceae bacterium]|nr:endosialidase [Lachnospiraceae bacterium]
MAVVEEIIRIESDGTISFGNHLLDVKTKVSDFEYDGDLYKVKTYNEITKLEKNGLFIYESVPGTSVHNLKITESGMEFTTEGENDAQITVELESDTEYTLFLDGINAGSMKSNLSGKVMLSILASNGQTNVKIVKA